MPSSIPTDAIYFTDPPYGLEKGMDDPKKELSFQGVYRIGPDGKLTLLTKDMERPNGIALVAGRKNLYVANSHDRAARHHGVSTEDRTASWDRAACSSTRPIRPSQREGACDGMTVDTDGNLWATVPGGVAIFTPEGKQLGLLATGDRTANCEFGEDGSTLFIAANHRVLKIRTTARASASNSSERRIHRRRNVPAHSASYMQALVLTEYRKLELQDVDRPKIGPNDVLVRVAACGICGSDVHGYDGSSGRRVPPIIMGHEAAGTIAEVGSAVDRAQSRRSRDVRFDDLVRPLRALPTRRCQFVRKPPRARRLLRRLSPARCVRRFVAVPQNILYPLPPDMPFEHAAFIEPVSVAVHAVDRLAIQPGERAVVVGSGMIGLLVIQALRVAGCRQVIAVDIDPGRLELAKEVGATETIDSKQTDAVSSVMELTGGEGADIAVEVVGNAAALATAIGCVRRGGRVGLVGNLAPEVPFPLQAVVTRELTLVRQLLISRRISAGNRNGRQRRHPRHTADQRHRATRRRPAMVRTPLRPRTRPDESHFATII